MESYEAELRKRHTTLLREASRFYMSEGNVFETLQRLTRRLDAQKISYALIDGMALAAHGVVRMTQDVDMLMSVEGLKAFHDRCVGRGYALAFNGAQKSFRDTKTRVKVKVVTTGEFPGDGKPKPVVFPDPATSSIEREGMRVLTLDRLIEVKLASGTSAPHRLRDLADVQDLIAVLALPEDFAERLDSSVRDAYRELWRATQQS